MVLLLPWMSGMQLFLKEFQFWWDKRKMTALSSKSRDGMMPHRMGQHLDRMGSVREWHYVLPVVTAQMSQSVPQCHVEVLTCVCLAGNSDALKITSKSSHHCGQGCKLQLKCAPWAVDFVYVTQGTSLAICLVTLLLPFPTGSIFIH